MGVFGRDKRITFLLDVSNLSSDTAYLPVLDRECRPSPTRLSRLPAITTLGLIRGVIGTTPTSRYMTLVDRGPPVRHYAGGWSIPPRGWSD